MHVRESSVLSGIRQSVPLGCSALCLPSARHDLLLEDSRQSQTNVTEAPFSNTYYDHPAG